MCMPRRPNARQHGAISSLAPSTPGRQPCAAQRSRNAPHRLGRRPGVAHRVSAGQRGAEDHAVADGGRPVRAEHVGLVGPGGERGQAVGRLVVGQRPHLGALVGRAGVRRGRRGERDGRRRHAGPASTYQRDEAGPPAVRSARRRGRRRPPARPRACPGWRTCRSPRPPWPARPRPARCARRYAAAPAPAGHRNRRRCVMRITSAVPVSNIKARWCWHGGERRDAEQRHATDPRGQTGRR